MKIMRALREDFTKLSLNYEKSRFSLSSFIQNHNFQFDFMKILLLFKIIYNKITNRTKDTWFTFTLQIKL